MQLQTINCAFPNRVRYEMNLLSDETNIVIDLPYKTFAENHEKLTPISLSEKCPHWLNPPPLLYVRTQYKCQKIRS